MPTNKDFKRLVRARMQKTGESYTSARVRLLTPNRARPKPAVVAAATPGVNSPDPSQYATLAGFTDATVKAKTGCPWNRWVKALDAKRAWEWEHDAIFAFVHEKYKVPIWWAQNVTVGYERIKGLRDRGQRRGGEYEATKSRVFAVPLQTLFAAWGDKKRKAWLPDSGYTVRSVTKDKYWRCGWPDGTSVAVNFYAKGKDKSQLQVQHAGITSKAGSDRIKAFWAERLDALGGFLA